MYQTLVLSRVVMDLLNYRKPGNELRYFCVIFKTPNATAYHTVQFNCNQHCYCMQLNKLTGLLHRVDLLRSTYLLFASFQIILT